jgi:hypothetical protein
MSQLRFPSAVVLSSWALPGKHGADGPGYGFAPFDDLREGQPFTLEFTPGTVAAANQTDLTVQIKDGATKSFTVDAQTHTRGTPTNGDQVVVITKNGAPNALAVLGRRA